MSDLAVALLAAAAGNGTASFLMQVLRVQRLQQAADIATVGCFLAAVVVWWME